LCAHTHTRKLRAPNSQYVQLFNIKIHVLAPLYIK